MSGLKLYQKVPASLQFVASALYQGRRKCLNSPHGCLAVGLSTTSQRELNTGPTVFGSSYLSDPENKGKRQSGVNFDTIGSWNNRIDMSISLKKSIEKGRLIPEIPLGNVHCFSTVTNFLHTEITLRTWLRVNVFFPWCGFGLGTSCQQVR